MHRRKYITEFFIRTLISIDWKRFVFIFNNGKAEALKGYKYCIAIENSRSTFYISEKFFDPLLNNCVPIYYGCTTIEKAYDSNSFVEFDLKKNTVIEDLREIIKQPISHRNDAIQKSKKDYFIKYNLLKYLEELLATPIVLS